MECASDSIQSKLVAQYQDHSDHQKNLIYQQQFQSTEATDLVDINVSTQLRNTQFLPNTPTCDKTISQLRGNNVTFLPQHKCDSNTLLARHYLIPCLTKPTYQNYVNCDSSKCCEVTHQIFGNLTRRK